MAKIIPGSNSSELAGKISDVSKIPLVGKTVRKFPDGETYVRLEDSDFKGEEVFIVHSLYPNQDESLVELFLTTDAVRENKGKPSLVIPYLAYARQDGTFQKGEAFSIKTIAKVLKALGTERVITVDPHFHRKSGEFDFFGIPAKNVSAVEIAAEHAEKITGGKFTVAGPDEGSKDFLSVMERSVFLKKEKYCPVCGMKATECRCASEDKSYVTKSVVPEGIENESVLLLDDMVSSGSTMIEAAKALKSKNNKVFAGCIHGLFIGKSLKELEKHTDYVFSTDTVKSEASKVSVAGILADELKG